MKRMIRMYEDYMYHENSYNKPRHNNLKYDKKDIERSDKDIEQSDKDIERSDKILKENNEKNDL